MQCFNERTKSKYKRPYEEVQRELLEKVTNRKEFLNQTVRISLAKQQFQESPITFGTQSYILDYESSEQRNLLKMIAEKVSGKSYAWFKEERGFRHWVLFRTDLFETQTLNCCNIPFINEEIEITYLHYKGDGEIEFPINLSSCFFMFNHINFSKLRKKDKEHNWYSGTTENVIDGVGVFYAAKFSGKSNFLKLFNTANMVKMDGMFYYAEFTGNATLPESFSTVNTVSMSYMFCRAFLNEAFTFAESFSTAKVFDMSWMFCDCDFLGNPFIGCKTFDTSIVIDMSHMFDSTSVCSCNFKLPENFNTDNLIYSKNMFYGKSLGIQFYRKNKTNKDIIKILKEWGIIGIPVQKMEDYYGWK